MMVYFNCSGRETKPPGTTADLGGSLDKGYSTTAILSLRSRDYRTAGLIVTPIVRDGTSKYSTGAWLHATSLLSVDVRSNLNNSISPPQLAAILSQAP